jgi:hypothetical protein
MRTEFAWMTALDADHYNLRSTPSMQYDLGIVIIPKKDPSFDINSIKQYCNKVAVMQEGPCWYWQDYSLDKQIWYYNTLIDSDIIFTHNQSDKKYYQGLTNHKDVRVMPSLMIEDAIGNVADVDRKNAIIGGNFVSWYGGFDSMIIAQELSDVIWAPSMGRKQDGEDQLIRHLPYLEWKDWIHKLNEFKYGVHLMRTHAAGTFALNCAYLGIPCIGYKGLDTQEILHPELTVELGDLQAAKELAKKIRLDEEFYLYLSNKARALYLENYTELKFKEKFII